ncbi:MAG: S8 family serine peptidase [Planctomycetota bacterium]|nr:S8 family serine peptidase [Planctomycetota bacterium]
MNSRQRLARPRVNRSLFVESMEERRLMAANVLQIESDSYQSDEFLVQFASDSVSNASRQLLGQTFAGGTVQRKLTDDGWFSVTVQPGTNLQSAMSAYRLRNDVQLVTPDFRMTLETTANDTNIGSQWGLLNTGVSGGLIGADIGATQAWQYGTSSTVVVGILDTGIDYNHPDLAANIWLNGNEIPGNGIDDDLNGYVDDRRGWDFANNDANPMDDNGHGTHVAGTVGAVGNNGIGVSGVAWSVRLMPLKFMDAQGSGSLSDAIEGINYARSMGAKIINASWGGGGFSSALQQAITQFQNAGGIFVAAAGNESSNNVTTPAFPANYSGVISVGASTRTDTLASFSNFGTNVDVVAPGASIFSTLPNNQYGSLSGTSMAAPHVAGALALLWGQNATASATTITNALLNNTDNVLRGTTSQFGRINVGKASAALLGTPAAPTPPTPTPTPPVPQAPVQRTYSSVGSQFLSDATSRSSTTTRIPITVSDDIRIGDINVVLDISHTWIGDLSIRLTSPTGVTTTLVQRRGGSGDNLRVTIDDDAGASISSIAAATNITGTFRGEQSLTAFRGLSARGVWTLQVTDQARGDTGVLNRVQLQITPTPTAASSTIGSEFFEWLSRLQRSRETTHVVATRSMLPALVDRIFSNW